MLCNPGRITHPFWSFCIKCMAWMGKMSWCHSFISLCSVGTLPPLSWPPASLQGQLEGHPGSSPYSLPVLSAEGAFLLHLGASLSSGCHILCSPPCGKYSEAVLRKACTPISTTAEGLLRLPAAAIKPHAPITFVSRGDDLSLPSLCLLGLIFQWIVNSPKTSV